jgi:hypothetical protein
MLNLFTRWLVALPASGYAAGIGAADASAEQDDDVRVVLGSLFHSRSVFGKKEWKRAGWFALCCKNRCPPLVLGSLGWT